ncbi:cadherin-related family member 5 isoform X2 [Mobula hypostoma]|uniref:cadherin-related family member 5 isoform X2 n=1 Tax=Mobula hypostoma TaxID=723540 RepID=UPI002FC32AE7
MDSFPRLRGFHLSVLLLLIAPLLKAASLESCSAYRECCVPEPLIKMEENNLPGEVISNITITKQPVSILPQSVADIVRVDGDTLQLSRTLDFEAMQDPVIIISLLCGPDKSKLSFYLEVTNVNDNTPTFPKNKLDANISELFPVGQSWKYVTAIDLDQDPIFYSLDNNTDGANFFLLKSENSPLIYLAKALDYEKETMLTLILNAKETANSVNISDSVTITVHVIDKDNKPPVFQPCQTLTDSSLCLNAKYSGSINQYQTESSPLSLKPHNILAVDGDTGINATILYQIVSDNHRAFWINANDGTLTMTRAINSSGLVTLTILAKQADNPYKYTTTSVTLAVLPVNRYPPEFPHNVYSGSIQANSPKGSIITKRGSSTVPLSVKAQDQDYPNKESPFLKYSLSPSDLFTITEFGLIFTKVLLTAAQSQYNITVTAMDVAQGDKCSAMIDLLVSSPDAPPSVKTTTALGTGPSEPVTHTARTVSAHTSKNPSRTPGTTDGQSPGPQPTSTKPPVIGTTPNLGTSGAGPSSSKHPDPGPGVTTPPSVKTTTALGTGPSEPVTHTARTVSAHTSKNPSRTPGTTDGQSPGPQPTSTKPPVIGTTPNLGTSGAGPSSSKHPDPGPGVTTPPSVKTTTALGTGPSEPVTHTARTVSAHTSKNPSRTPGTTDGQSPGPQPTSTKPPVIGTTPNLGTSGAGPSSSKHPDPGPGVTTPPSVKTTTALGTGPSEPVTHTARTVSAHTSKNPSRTPGTTDGQSPGPQPTSTKPPVIGTTPNLGTSGAGPSSSKHPDPGPGVTTPPSVKTTTALGTGPSEPVTHTARTVSAHTSKNPSRTPGTTDGQSPGPQPTSTKPPVIGTTPNLGTSGAGPSSSKHPDPGPGVTNNQAHQRLLYDAKHMVAVGVPLSLLLLICIIMIGILLQDGGWAKLKRRTAAQLKCFSRQSHSSESDSVQLTNQDFLVKETLKSSLKTEQLPQQSAPMVTARALDSILEPAVDSNPGKLGAIANSSSPGHDSAQNSLEEVTTEGEMKSILTKERKTAEGYKAVWFKEDIEPQANEERVIESPEDDKEGVDGSDNDDDANNDDDGLYSNL